MDIYQVREQLESFAARLAAEQTGTDELLKLEHIIQEMHDQAASRHLETIVEIDVSLHKTIIRRLRKLDDQYSRDS
jgi:DNA-binding GntR family transcriptional regulator